jgi:hypothetical protein
VILYECYADETLLSALGFQRQEIEHAGGINNVGKRLESNYTKSVGMIDEDPGKPRHSYIKKCNFINAAPTNVNLKVQYDNIRKNYIVVICPDLEPWILDVAKIENIDVTTYGLSKNPDTLHDELSFRTKQLQNFKKLIIDLEAKSNHIKTLKNLIIQFSKP